MKNILTHIKDYYRVDVDEFIKLYSEGLGRKDIAESIGVTESTVRSVAGLLSLRLNKIYRNEDVNALKVRLNQVSNNELTNVLKQNDMLAKELYKTKSSLQLYKDKLNLVNRQLRDNIRENNIYEELQKVVLENLNYDKLNNINLAPYDKDEETTFVVLSDLHIGALVDSSAVKGQNKFNFNIAKRRIEYVIKEALQFESKQLHIVFLGDIFDGLIHNSQLIAEMPVTQAVTEFAHWFTSLLNSLQKAYNKPIKISTVSGNHERIDDTQKFYKKGYDFTYIFMVLLDSLNPNINMTYFIEGYGKIDLGGGKIGLITHGDIDRGFKPYIQSSQLKLMTHCNKFYGQEPHLILTGHTHTYGKGLLPNGGVAITVGSLIGQNEYAFNNGFIATPPVQVILVYDKKGNLQFEKIVNLEGIK